MTREEIARILKDLRISAGLTQNQAALAIGRKQQTLASWETGQSQPDANTLFVLCALYGASVDEAFGFKQTRSPKTSSTEQFLYSPETIEVAAAYDKATLKEKDLVRRILDLPPIPCLDLVEDEEPPLIAARGEQPSRGVMESQEAGIAKAILHAPRLTEENNDGIV